MVGTNNRISGCPGFNPQGAIAVAGVTTGAYVYTNNDNVDEELIVTGGTVTTIVKNGVTLYSFGGAAASAALFLYPGEAVTINNTVVPTIVKDRK
jgi:hypothetical protein